MTQTILITGINGFVGKHLAREVHSRGLNVIGVGQSETTIVPEISSIVKDYYQADITDHISLQKLPLKDINSVINLAGLANVGASFDNPDLYMRVNVEVLSVLGNELLNVNSSVRMVAVSTGGLYDPNQSMPLSESSKSVENGSPYAMSKLAMEKAAGTLRKQGLECAVVRPFNHIGPGQGLGFLIPDLINKLRQANPSSPRITAGNLKTVRDYSDVRDIAKAYVDLALSEVLDHELYNVCSGQGHSGEDIVKALCNSLGIDYGKLTVDINPSLIRPTDPARIIGDHSTLTEDTGWEPSISFNQTIDDIVKSL